MDLSHPRNSRWQSFNDMDRIEFFANMLTTCMTLRVNIVILMLIKMFGIKTTHMDEFSCTILKYHHKIFNDVKYFFWEGGVGLVRLAQKRLIC